MNAVLSFLVGVAVGALGMRGGARIWVRARMVELEDAQGAELDRLAKVQRYREESIQLRGFAREVVDSDARVVRDDERRKVVPMPRRSRGESA